MERKIREILRYKKPAPAAPGGLVWLAVFFLIESRYRVLELNGIQAKQKAIQFVLTDSCRILGHGGGGVHFSLSPGGNGKYWNGLEYSLL